VQTKYIENMNLIAPFTKKGEVVPEEVKDQIKPLYDVSFQEISGINRFDSLRTSFVSH
jgi:hypothetical protein